MKLLLGTHNSGKKEEISNLLRGLDIEFLTLRNFPETTVVEESGVTYEENALLKAQGYARQTGLWTLADDSGLEVDALDGAPGVLSARYAGADASDSDRVVRLLSQLEEVPAERRTARFVCVLALADAAARVIRIERGICEGTIIDSARGTNGFGYDPIFVPLGFTNTFGELPAEVKDSISHRGQALQAMRHFLSQLDTST